MAYHVTFSPRARRELGNLPRAVQVRIKPRIDALADEPRPPGVKKLSGESELYRIRVGDYRVLYAIEDEELEAARQEARTEATQRSGGAQSSAFS